MNVRVGATLCALVLWLMCTAQAAAQPATTTTTANTLPWIDITLFDAPYGTEHGLRLPGMRQSLDFSIVSYEALHDGVERLFGGRRNVARVAIAVADVVTTVALALPLTSVWVHEEFHRAAMGSRGIDSHNDVYNFDVGSEWIAVSHVADDDLARLKREHPAEWVRVNAAGMEGELLLVRDLERRQFFGQSRSWHLPLYWITKLGTWGYVASGNWAETDAEVDEANIEDGPNVERRDFTGHDFLGWVYDLHRPDEPYEARGLHPSGTGIDRYRKRSHLTDAEQSYLRQQGRLQLLNFVDPFLLGLDRGIELRAGARPLRLTFGLSHHLTSFGHVVNANVLARREGENVAFTIHSYSNKAGHFWGAEAELLDRAVNIGGRAWQLSPRLAVWMQPRGQRFDTVDSQVGGLAGLRLRTRLKDRFGAFVDVETKSTGWVAGSPYLDPNTSVRLGLAAFR